MITEALMDLFFGLIGSAVGLFPDGGAPSWMTDAGSMFSDVVGYASGLGAWIPFTLAGTVLTAVLACVALGFTIKLVRIVASFFTAGGGSAA